MKNDNFLIAAALSVVSGAVIGLLLSDDEPSGTKEQIRNKGDKYLDHLKRELRDIRGDIDSYRSTVKKEAENKRDEVYARAEEVLQRAKNLSSDYEQWTREKLAERAQKFNIEGCLSMSKDELIKALKNIR